MYEALLLLAKVKHGFAIHLCEALIPDHLGISWVIEEGAFMMVDK